jgi:hypothetical protein
MIEDIRIISVYNVLIFQLVILSLSTKTSALNRLEFLKIWSALKIPFFPKTKKIKGKRREKFWEIDMTKFKS